MSVLLCWLGVGSKSQHTNSLKKNGLNAIVGLLVTFWGISLLVSLLLVYKAKNTLSIYLNINLLRRISQILGFCNKYILQKVTNRPTNIFNKLIVIALWCWLFLPTADRQTDTSIRRSTWI